MTALVEFSLAAAGLRARRVVPFRTPVVRDKPDDGIVRKSEIHDPLADAPHPFIDRKDEMLDQPVFIARLIAVFRRDGSPGRHLTFIGSAADF